MSRSHSYYMRRRLPIINRRYFALLLILSGVAPLLLATPAVQSNMGRAGHGQEQIRIEFRCRFSVLKLNCLTSLQFGEDGFEGRLEFHDRVFIHEDYVS